MIIGSTSRIMFARIPRLVITRSQVMKYAKSVQEQQKQFWDKNAKLRRPQSPHLTIYRLPLPAVLSVAHRGTGVTLSGITILFGLGSLYWTGNFEQMLELVRTYIHPHLILTAKAGLAAVFCYKTYTGLRHLYWDTGRGLGMANVYRTGYVAMAFSVVGGILLALSTL